MVSLERLAKKVDEIRGRSGSSNTGFRVVEQAIPEELKLLGFKRIASTKNKRSSFLKRFQIITNRLRKAQATPDEEAFDKYFPKDDSDRKMFEPQEADQFDFLGETIRLPSTSEGFQELEDARAKIEDLKKQYETIKPRLLRGYQRGFLGKFEVIQKVYPYFEARATLAQAPMVTLKEEFLMPSLALLSLSS